MIHRVAIFAGETDIPEEYRKEPETENFFEPDYNLPVGGDLRLIVSGKKSNEHQLKTARWGKSRKLPDPSAILEREKFWETVKNKRTKPCVILLSGFYIWKTNREKEHPFFVRMLNNPVMPVAGVLLDESAYASMILVDSNPLIHPMSEKMPLILNGELMKEWLNRKEKHGTFVQEYKDPFLLTDFSVLRVSKKVNDLKNNDESLIQPIPK